MQIIKSRNNEFEKYNLDYIFVEEYIGASNPNYFGFQNYSGGTGATVSLANSEEGHDGILRFRSSAAGSRAGMRSGANGTVGTILFGNREYYLEWIFKISAPVTPDNNIALDFGFGDNNSGAPNNSCLFLRGDATGWQIFLITQTINITPTIPLNTDWNKVGINLKKNGKQCLFYLNDNLIYNYTESNIILTQLLFITMHNQKIISSGTPHDVFLDRFVMGVKN